MNAKARFQKRQVGNLTTSASPERVTLRIEGITHAGDGVGRHAGMAVFVAGALPGETVVAEIGPVRKNHAVARLVAIRKPSPDRREPPCPHFAACGGCSLQHLAYPAQLSLKTGLVRDSLRRLGGLDVTVRDTAGMTGSAWHYRNKVHLQAARPEGRIALGFYAPKSHRLTALFPDGDGCLLVHPALNAAAADAADLLAAQGAAQPERFFRRVLLRRGAATGEIMVVVVTGTGPWPREKEFAAELVRRRPEIRSVVLSRHPGPGGTVLGTDNRVLAGGPFITDRLDTLQLRLSPASFYQVNPAQTRVLYREAAAMAGLSGAETVVDAYSGVGALALWLSGRARLVRGLEIERAAVTDARANAALNGIGNVAFQQGDVAALLPTLAAPDVVVLDPPRRGCAPAVLAALAALGAPRVVYVSCDPGTLARDLAALTARVYRIDAVQPVDMFPWTPHIETVAGLRRKTP